MDQIRSITESSCTSICIGFDKYISIVNFNIEDGEKGNRIFTGEQPFSFYKYGGRNEEKERRRR